LMANRHPTLLNSHALSPVREKREHANWGDSDTPLTYQQVYFEIRVAVSSFNTLSHRSLTGQRDERVCEMK
ncbi:hypothetical protein PENTCL1PPCAC_20583, partial [Pristionchus entomophagus]